MRWAAWGHGCSAVEASAAARQSRSEQMYQRMFTTRTEWGEQRVPADDLFQSFAVDLGFDSALFDAAHNSPARLERIRADGQRLRPTTIDEPAALVHAAAPQ